MQRCDIFQITDKSDKNDQLAMFGRGNESPPPKSRFKRPPKLSIAMKHFGKSSAFEEDSPGSPSSPPPEGPLPGMSSPEPAVTKSMWMPATPDPELVRQPTIHKPSTPPSRKKVVCTRIYKKNFLLMLPILFNPLCGGHF